LVKKTKTTDNEDEIKKQLEHLKAQLKQQTKKGKPKKATKVEKGKPKKVTKAEKGKPKKVTKAEKGKPKKVTKAEKGKPKKATKAEKGKPKKATKAEKEKAKKAIKAEKEKAKKAIKAEKEKAKKAIKAEKEKAKKAIKAEEEKQTEKTPEEELEEQFSDEQIRNFQIERKDMDRITNQVCEIVSNFGDNGMLQSDLWKKLKLSNRDGSRLALRLERRGLISREKILQKDRWTYKLIIEQTPVSLESLQNSPCLTCPVEQKCELENVYPEPSPLYCQLIEDWVIEEFSKKKK
jgi:hypothetical protein